MRGSSTSLVLVLALAASCDAPAPEPVKAEPVKAEPVKAEPPVQVELEPPAPEPPPMPAFDPAAVAKVRGRILAIPNRESWVACGIRHSVGVLEVEVLDVGEPAPRMLLFISCPIDGRVQQRGLVVGSTITATLHARPQRWSSVAGLPKDLPRRYVESFTVAELPSDPG